MAIIAAIAPQPDKLWDELIKPENLKLGWFLARKDNRATFIEDLFLIEAFGKDLDNNLKELSNLLKADKFYPKALTHIEVPKNSLAVRPGSKMCIEDSVVLFAIMRLIVEPLDKELHKNVLSFRYKRNAESRDILFKEWEVEELPAYLKRKTITKRVDPFDPWYALWPEFDRKSQEAYKQRGYNFLAVSDISAYFENIQIPILRDALLKILPTEHRLVNLLILFFESWALKTPSGRIQWRGIPQGNSVSSFLGNFFLLELDREFIEFQKSHDVEYWRYMDDIRIFTKSEKDARTALLLLDRTLRRLHLNVQSSKTKIYNNNFGEIQGLLEDERLESINQIIVKIPRIKKADRPQVFAQMKALTRTASKYRTDSKKIIGPVKKKLEGLDYRFFRRWITAHYKLNSAAYVPRLISEMRLNPDSKLTGIVIKTVKNFPKKKILGDNLIEFLNSDANIFPYQEAEIIRALRYVDAIPQSLISYCKLKALTGAHFYPRIQAIYLLYRVQLTESELEQFTKLFEDEPNEDVQVALAGLLTQHQGLKNIEILKKLVFHPNDKIRRVGKLFREIKLNDAVAVAELKFLFESSITFDTSTKLCDYMPYIYLMSQSSSEVIKNELESNLKKAKDKVKHSGNRVLLNEIYKKLQNSKKPPQMTIEEIVLPNVIMEKVRSARELEESLEF